MRNNILITMALLILIGLAVQGLFGVAAGILVSAVIGIVYGVWSVVALIIDLICIIAFYFRLMQVM